MLVKVGWVCSKGYPCVLAQQMCMPTGWAIQRGKNTLKQKVVLVVYKSAIANDARPVCMLLELLQNVIFLAAFST